MRNERVFNVHDALLYAVVSVVLFAAVAFFGAYWMRPERWAAHPAVLAALTVPSFVGLGMYLARWLSLPLATRPLEMPAPTGWSVGVATTFVPGAEPLEMLEETVAALVAMDYAHETWVLDEGDDPAVRELCDRLGAHHFSRRRRPEYQRPDGAFERRSKHGNYNSWLHEIAFDRFDVIVGFDPDHVPARDFLDQTLGYLRDESVGYVQAAQVYYNQRASFIARGAAEETYAYYSSIQMTSYALGYPIVTGCHHVHRTAALSEIGGLPAHEADDLLATIKYRAAGWRGVYVPKTLAVGLTPVNWADYMSQQRRWARSVLDIKFRVHWKLARDLPPLERALSFAHGFYYLHGLTTALGVLVLGLMLVTGAIPDVLSFHTLPYAAALAGALLMSDTYRQRFFLNPGERGLHWRAGLLRFAKWPAVLAATKDALRPRRADYALTPKTRQPPRRRRIVVPHALTVVFLLVTATLGYLNGVDSRPLWAATALLLVLSLLVIASSLLPEAAPYDPALRRRTASAVACSRVARPGDDAAAADATAAESPG